MNWNTANNPIVLAIRLIFVPPIFNFTR